MRRRAGAEVACEKKSRNRKSMLVGELEQKEHVGRRAGAEAAWYKEKRNLGACEKERNRRSM